MLNPEKYKKIQQETRRVIYQTRFMFDFLDTYTSNVIEI